MEAFALSTVQVVRPTFLKSKAKAGRTTMVCIRVLSSFSSIFVEHAKFDGFNVLTHVRVHANEEHSSMIVRPTRPVFPQTVLALMWS